MPGLAIGLRAAAQPDAAFVGVAIVVGLILLALALVALVLAVRDEYRRTRERIRGLESALEDGAPSQSIRRGVR